MQFGANKLINNALNLVSSIILLLALIACCRFTGLSYIDLCNLTKEDIKLAFDGKLWIMIKREKTGVDSNVPLLEIPKQILAKYEGKMKGGKLLPVISNQITT